MLKRVTPELANSQLERIRSRLAASFGGTGGNSRVIGTPSFVVAPRNSAARSNRYSVANANGSSDCPSARCRSPVVSSAEERLVGDNTKTPTSKNIGICQQARIANSPDGKEKRVAQDSTQFRSCLSDRIRGLKRSSWPAGILPPQ